MIDITKLSESEKKALKADLFHDEKENEKQRKKEVESYKQLVKRTVENNIAELVQASAALASVKAKVFLDFSTLVDLKKELFDYKDGQKSHTFSTAEGQTVEIGFRTTDGWDDTVDVGIEKINEYMESLSTSEETANLVKIINSLLKKDAKGNLKANRVLDLQNLADEIGNDKFRDGVETIRAAYQPNRSAYYIEAYYKHAVTGARVSIPLSITSVGFPEEIESLNF